MAFNPLHNSAGSPALFMVSVIRYTDKAVVASYSVSEAITKEGVRELVASNGSCQPGKRYSAVGQSQAVHYTLDQHGRVYAIVSEPKYPPRVAFSALDELISSFQKEFGFRIAAAKEGSLSKAARPMLKDFIDKFENPRNVDKLVAVQERVEVVKTVMKDNSKFNCLYSYLICKWSIMYSPADADQRGKVEEDRREH